MSKVLEVKNLHAWYGESHILQDVNFSVNEGEVVTLLGRNGAGRTSTLKAIMGLTGKREGSIKIHGIESINANLAVIYSSKFPSSSISG